jgi:hypothetical protein
MQSARKQLRMNETVDIPIKEQYEACAKAVGWETQESCRVEFQDLPEANKKVMIAQGHLILGWMEEYAAQQLPSDMMEFTNSIGYNYNYLGDGKWQKRDFDDMPLHDLQHYTTEFLYNEWARDKYENK